MINLQWFALLHASSTHLRQLIVTFITIENWEIEYIRKQSVRIWTKSQL